LQKCFRDGFDEVVLKTRNQSLIDQEWKRGGRAFPPEMVRKKAELIQNSKTYSSIVSKPDGGCGTVMMKSGIGWSSLGRKSGDFREISFQNVADTRKPSL